MKITKISKNIVDVPSVVTGKLKRLLPKIVRDIKNLHSNPAPDYYTLKFPDPYKSTRKHKTVYVFVVGDENINGVSATIEGAFKHTSYMKVIANPNVMLYDPAKEPKLTESVSIYKVYDILMHEMVHAINPAERFLNADERYFNTKDMDSYYVDRGEIDAFQTSMVHKIISAINNEKVSKEEVESLLQGPITVNLMLALFSIDWTDAEALSYWIENRPDIMRLFKQRLYSEIQSKVNVQEASMKIKKAQPKRIKSQSIRNEVKGQYTVRAMLRDLSKWKNFLELID